MGMAQDKLYTEQRPWGFFTILEEGENFKVKKIVVKPEQRLSLQLHKHRKEQWVIVQGQARVTCGDKIHDLTAGEHIQIPKHSVHRVENTSSDDVVIIEVQIGDYLGEDDIVRLEDDYSRS